MFGLGTPELLVIFGIAFLIFGGRKLPEIGAGVGHGIRNFKNAIRGDGDREQLDDKKEGPCV